MKKHSVYKGELILIAYLKLRDPTAMPVGSLVPPDEELSSAGRLRLGRLLLPAPGQDLAHLALQRLTLRNKK